MGVFIPLTECIFIVLQKILRENFILGPNEDFDHLLIFFCPTQLNLSCIEVSEIRPYLSDLDSSKELAVAWANNNMGLGVGAPRGPR